MHSVTPTCWQTLQPLLPIDHANWKWLIQAQYQYILNCAILIFHMCNNVDSTVCWLIYLLILFYTYIYIFIFSNAFCVVCLPLLDNAVGLNKYCLILSYLELRHPCSFWSALRAADNIKLVRIWCEKRAILSQHYARLSGRLYTLPSAWICNRY